MTGTTDCVYETPCGWCSKWDKKCDEKPKISTKIEDKVLHDIKSGKGLQPIKDYYSISDVINEILKSPSKTPTKEEAMEMLRSCGILNDKNELGIGWE